MKFVIEATGWKFDPGNASEEIERFEQVLDLVDRAIERGEVLYSSDMFTCEVVEGYLFHDLYNPAAPLHIPPYVQERVAAAFLRLGQWEDTNDWPADTDVSIGDREAVYLPSVAWMHRQISCAPELPSGVIIFNRFLTGVQSVSVLAIKPVNMYFLQTISDWARFCRYLILSYTKNSKELSELAEDAFPDLDFVKNSLFGIDKMSRPYRVVLPYVVRHLAVLSDHGARTFSASFQEAPKLFAALGIDVSDENGNTRSDREARRQRTRIHRGTEITCWWHSKIEPHRDRIHLYIPPDTDNPRIVIGILCLHLK